MVLFHFFCAGYGVKEHCAKHVCVLHRMWELSARKNSTTCVRFVTIQAIPRFSTAAVIAIYATRKLPCTARLRDKGDSVESLVFFAVESLVFFTFLLPFPPKCDIIYENFNIINLQQKSMFFRLTSLLFCFGKNAGSTSAQLIEGKICVAAIGACVFRAQLRLRTFYI